MKRDPARDRAGAKYETIRRRLIYLFTLRGCIDAEALADETLDRAARKASEVAETYSGDPTRYIYAVARHVLRESRKRAPAREPMLPELTTVGSADEKELPHGCLEKCLEQLKPSDRELILQYYRAGKEGAESNRQELSQSLGISPNALRIRVHRLSLVIQECVKSCLEQPEE